MERLYTRLVRNRELMRLSLILNRDLDCIYRQARYLGSIGLDILSVQDQTSEYDAKEGERKRL